jgi:CrcB protein
MHKYVAVMSGAALGGLARYLMVSFITARLVSRFPWGTFAVNVIGCFLIGLISTILAERSPSSAAWGLFLVTGILGGYTTFSAFGWETVQLSRQGEHWLALGNVLGSAAAGYLAVWLGVFLVKR